MVHISTSVLDDRYHTVDWLCRVETIDLGYIDPTYNRIDWNMKHTIYASNAMLCCNVRYSTGYSATQSSQMT